MSRPPGAVTTTGIVGTPPPRLPRQDEFTARVDDFVGWDQWLRPPISNKDDPPATEDVAPATT